MSNDQKTDVSTETKSKRQAIIDGINKVGAFLKIPLLKILNTTAFFSAIYLGLLILNGIYEFHFDLSAVKDFYLLLLGKQTADHGINSIFNSNKGEMPDVK